LADRPASLDDRGRCRGPRSACRYRDDRPEITSLDTTRYRPSGFPNPFDRTGHVASHDRSVGRGVVVHTRCTPGYEPGRIESWWS